MNQNSLMYTIGVWGCGIVGGNTARLFDECSKEKVKVLRYDKYKIGEWVPPEDLVLQSDIIFLCLPTPMNREGDINLSYIDLALQEISDYLKNNSLHSGKIIIIRSTIVPGSSDMFSDKYFNLNIVVIPEFLTEANSWQDILNTNRIVIGTPDRIAFFVIEALYKLVYDKVDYIYMKRKEAELYKYACNFLLAMSVLAANELYFICKSLGIDYSVIQGNLKYDRRIGTHTLVPGPDRDVGIGGKCLPKDLYALACLAQSKGYNPTFIDAGIALNERIRKNRDWINIPGAVSSCAFEEEKGELK